MSEKYISLVDAVKAVNDIPVPNDSYYANITDAGKQLVISELESIKTADVAPVIHGHWCEDEFDVWCSNCFCAYPKDKTRIADWRKMSKYCDNCGAKMESEV